MEAYFFGLNASAALLETPLKTTEQCVKAFSLFPFNFY